jgi:hypothetical protein
MGAKPRTRTRPDPAASDLPTPDRERLIDEAIRESFPASDPPAYGGPVRVGEPEREEPNTKED